MNFSRRVARPHLQRRTRKRGATRRELAAAILVVLAGVAIVTGVIAGSPRWHTIIASWRDAFSAWSAKVSLATETRADEARLQEARRPAPPASALGLLATSSSSSAELEHVQLMASLLVAHLGPDPAWRTAHGNANSHDPDSPEFAYWHRVAATIRDPRPGQ